jgi:hypothetical protein
MGTLIVIHVQALVTEDRLEMQDNKNAASNTEAARI